MSHKVCILALLLGSLLPLSAQAQWQFSAGLGLRQTQVAEYAPSGQKLVNELGWLPGMQLRAERPLGAWHLALYGSLHGGDIDYDGRLQAGTPFQTETETQQSRLGLEFALALNPSVQFIAGLEWDYWKRQIQGRNGVLGLDERYTSWRALGGAEFDLLQASAGVVQARTLLIASAPEKLRVRFDTALFDEARFDTKAGVGARLGLEFIPNAAPALTVGVEFDWLRVPRSSNAALRQAGNVVGTLAQPEHVRRAFDLYLMYRF